MNPIGGGHRVSLSVRLNPAPPSSGRLGPWCCGGSVCSVGRDEYGWPRCSGSASGAAEIEPGRVTNRTLPWENTERLPSPQMCTADPACAPPRGRENTYFCPSWEIRAWTKRPCTLIWVQPVMGNVTKTAEIAECGEESANDRQLRIDSCPCFYPTKNKNRVRNWPHSLYGASL